MSNICLPKAFVCATGGQGGYKPTFTPSSQPCSLPSYNERRSRNNWSTGAANVLFRSIDVGADTNNITISSEWQNVLWFSGSGQYKGTTNTTPLLDDYQVMDVTVTVTNGNTTNTYTTEYFETKLIPKRVELSQFVFDGNQVSLFPDGSVFMYFADSSALSNDMYTVSTINSSTYNSTTNETTVPIVGSVDGTPNSDGTVGINPGYGGQKFTSNGTGGGSWDISAVGEVRSLINSNDPLVNMPTNDNGNTDVSIPSYTSDPDHIGEFSNVSLEGGDGAPPTPPSNLRTGPVFSLVFISQSEIQNTDGTLDSLNEVRYWGYDQSDQLDWLLLSDQKTNDCYDPNNLPNGFSCP